MVESRFLQFMLPRSRKQADSLFGVTVAYWRLIGLSSLLGAVVGLAVAFSTRPVYRADARIIPVSEDVATSRVLSSGIVDLAALAGISIGGGGSSEANIAYLQSDALLIGYINEHEALNQVFDDEWDPVSKRWRDSAPGKLPTMGKALRRLHKSMYFVSVDKKTGVITVSIRHHQPEFAAQWANGLIADANRNLRDRDMNESARAIQFLQREAENGVQPVELKQALYRLIEEQMKKRAVAAARDEYAFRVIDKARVPELWEKVAPVRRVIAGLSAIVGGLLGFGAALLSHRFASPAVPRPALEEA